jgi:cyclomaltodextrinase
VTAPSWARPITWYHLYPLGFLGAEPRNPDPIAADTPVRHRSRGLEAWLDYLVDLGVGGLLLGPVFASESHGYDTVDYFRVDPRLGDEDDLIGFCDACHRRGLPVLLDGVFNHVARSFPAFADVLAHRAESRYAGWFRLDFDAPGPDGFAYEAFEGHRHLVALNHAEPAVRELAVSVADHWIERGADGFRLDAAYAVPVAFWAAFAQQVRARRRDAYLLGEVIHGDYARFVRESTLDAVTQYERAVEGDLERAERPEPVRAGPRDGSPPDVRRRLPAADLRRQPRRDPHRQPAPGARAPRPRPVRPLHLAREPGDLRR